MRYSRLSIHKFSKHGVESWPPAQTLFRLVTHDEPKECLRRRLVDIELGRDWMEVAVKGEGTTFERGYTVRSE